MNTHNKTTFTALVALAAISWCAPLGAQLLAPAFTLHAGPAIEVQPEENYVMQQPSTSYGVPFRPTISASEYAAAKQMAASYAPLGSKQGALGPAPLAPPTTVFANFNGAKDVDGLRPPDTHGAVGLKHFVEVTNSHFDVFAKGTHALAKSVTLATFFNYGTETIFDPRVVYDSTWNRWVVTAEAFAESNTVQRFFIGISKTSSPTGAFWIYNVNVDFFGNHNFFDFPQLGLDQDSVLITANIFPAAGGFAGADFFAVAKARLYNGFGWSVPVFTGLVGTLAPPIVLDQNGSTFLLGVPTGGTTFTKYTVSNSSRSNIGLTSSTVTVPSYTVPPDARQVGTTDLLDTSDSRFVNASTQNGTDLWQAHTIALGGFPAPKFYRINTSTNAVSQSGFFFRTSTSDDFNASITANTNSDAFVTWSSTDPTNSKNAQVVFSGKRNTDTAMGSGTVGVTSSTFYNPTTDNPERWGDYSAITIDPSSTSKAWLVNEKINSTSAWGSQIMQVGF